MSTKINDVHTSGDTLTIDVGHAPNTVLIQAIDNQNQRESQADNLVNRADFLAAVEAELGVIIVDVADLPTVDYHDTEGGFVSVDDSEYGSGVVKSEDAADLYREALVYLALARYAESLPKIDPAQVDALSSALSEASGQWMTTAQATKIARELLKSGKVEVKNNG